jgi:carboxyl-terminal processing protease
MDEYPINESKARRERTLLILAVVLSILLVASCFAIPYLLSSSGSSSKSSAGSTGSTGFSRAEKGELEGFLLESGPYVEAQDIVENNYVDAVGGDQLLDAGTRGIRRMADEGADDATLVDRGIVAMLDSLDDPFSAYMDPKELEMLDTQLSGHFSGIGVAMQTVKNEIRVVKVLEGTPAQETGMQEGDIVKEVDGKDVTGIALDEVVLLIRGPEGSTVRVGVARPPSSNLIQFDIVRRDIEFPVIDYEMKENGIGYLKLADWTQDVDQKISGALQDLREKGAKGLVMDLRSNPGGYMEPAIKAADLFLRGGVIVSSKGRVAGATKEYTADDSVEWDLPVVILVDRGSASSSEIFASALHDNGRCTLVGETTFGKGSIQKIFRQEDGSGLRLTIARYYTPDGSSIDDEGIDPDVLVRNPVVGDKDLQLDKAIEALMGSGLRFPEI